MNVAGLNNLALAPKPKDSVKGGATPNKDAKSSFEGVLGQATSSANDTTPAATASDKFTKSPVQDAPDTDDGATDVEGSAFDRPATPTLGGLTERLAAPVSPVTPNPLTAVLAKQTPTEDETGVDQLTRRVVWNDFLRKMKDDLGVTAEDVLGAFSALSNEDLAKPPTETLDKVVMALGLNDQQAQMAKQYFSELIQKTQTRSFGDEFKNGNPVSLSLMSQKELQQKNMRSALQNMNEQFFMKSPPPAQPTDSRRPTEEALALAKFTPELEAPAAPVALSQAPAPAPLQQLAAQMQKVNPDETPEKSVDELVQKFMSAQTPSTFAKAKAQALAAAATSVAEVATPTATTPSAPAVPKAALESILAKLGAAGDESADEQFTEDSLDASFLNMPLAADGSKLNGAIQSNQDFKTQLAQVNPGQPMAVPDLVQHAQVMVRDGGGEMKVTMTPEGLGEVAMKVSVEQGKVQISMVTESDEAKKLIERQLGELKSSLTQHHLQIADIKVDTAQSMGRQLEQQYQDAQRQATQSQWEQFRQDNQGWRRSFFDVGSSRAYKGQADATRDVAAPSSTQPRPSGSARRLNLVA